MKKVLSHLLYARVAAAHIITPYVIGEEVLLATAFTSDELRAIDGSCTVVVNAFAWAMSHLGRFLDEDTMSIPVLPVRAPNTDVTFDDFRRGLFPDILAYVVLHTAAANGVNIPADEIALVRPYADAYGLALNPAGNRFPVATVNIWNTDPAITPAQ